MERLMTEQTMLERKTEEQTLIDLERLMTEFGEDSEVDRTSASESKSGSTRHRRASKSGSTRKRRDSVDTTGEKSSGVTSGEEHSASESKSGSTRRRRASKSGSTQKRRDSVNTGDEHS